MLYQLFKPVVFLSFLLFSLSFKKSTLCYAAPLNNLYAAKAAYPFSGSVSSDTFNDHISFVSSIKNAVGSKKKIVILLRSSWNDMNIGDIGHTPGTLRLLERYIPEAEILLWHEQRRPITEAIVIKNFPKVKIVRGAFLGKDMQMEQELKEAFDKADVYIHNSGMNSVRRAPLLFNPYGLRLWATCRTQENKVCVFRQRWICSPMQTLQEIYTGEEQGNKP